MVFLGLYRMFVFTCQADTKSDCVYESTSDALHDDGDVIEICTLEWDGP